MQLIVIVFLASFGPKIPKLLPALDRYSFLPPFLKTLGITTKKCGHVADSHICMQPS